jgi:hypothetical protein
MTTLQGNVKLRSAANYRTSYLDHITRYWKSWQDITGIVALKKIGEMRKIEATYVQARDNNFNVTLDPDVVVLPKDALEKEVEQSFRGRGVILPRGNTGQLRLTAGGFRIQR